MANLIEIVITGKNEAKTAIAEAKKDGEGLSGTFSKLGTVGGLALAGIAIASVDMATKYETATTRLVTSAGESVANIDMVRKGMLNMAGQVGVSAIDLAKGMYTVESAGYHGAAGLTVLKAAAQGAADEGADLGTVANAVTDVLVDYHMKASDAADVTSKMVTAVSFGKTTFQDFSGSMHNILPLASAMNLSFADVSGVLAEMTAHGMSADQASQNMANAMRSLIAPTHTQQAEFKLLGTSAAEVRDKLGTVGLSGTMQYLYEISKTVSPNILEQEAAFKKLMGTAPGLSVALMTTGENFDATTAAIKGIGGATADAQGNVQGFAEMQKTLGQKVKELTASFDTLMIELGNKLLPIIKVVVDWMNKHHDVIEATIVGVGLLAAGLAAYTAIVKIHTAMTAAWTAAQKLANLAMKEGEATTGAMGTAMAALPIAGTLVGIGMLSNKLGEMAGVGDHTGQSLTTLTKVFLDVADGSVPAAQHLGDMADALMTMSQRANDNKPVQGLKDMDSALAQLVSSGHADQAQASVQAITDHLSAMGVSVGYIHDRVLPQYYASLQNVDNQQRKNAKSTGDLAKGQQDAADAQAFLTDSTAQAAQEWDDAKKAASAYQNQLDGLFGRFGTYSDAVSAFTVDMSDATSKIHAGTDATDLNTVAGAKNFQELQKLSVANMDVAKKMIETNMSSDDATRSLRAGAQAIDDLAKKSGFTDAQIKQLNLELYGVPKVTDLTIKADTTAASNALGNLKTQLDSITAGLQKVGSGGMHQAFAHGGEIGAAATGGDRSGLVWVGEQGPELVRLPTGSTARSNPDSMAALAGGAGRGGTGRIQLEWVGGNSGDSFIEWLRANIRIRGGNSTNSVQAVLGQAF